MNYAKEIYLCFALGWVYSVRVGFVFVFIYAYVCVCLCKPSCAVLSCCVWLVERTVDRLWFGLSVAELILISLLGKSAYFEFVHVCIYTVCVLLLSS